MRFGRRSNAIEACSALGNTWRPRQTQKVLDGEFLFPGGYLHLGRCDAGAGFGGLLGAVSLAALLEEGGEGRRSC